MAENTKIEWAHHTFNPWVGCQKVSPACDNCYAEDWAKRFGQVEWGPHAVRKRTSASNWSKPLKWDKRAAAAGERHRVFCASLADVFDNRAPEGARDDLWALIRATQHLDWMLLTKRPQNIAKMLPDDWGEYGYPNVWLGTTVENQAEADQRISQLLRVPAPVRFLSCEPLLGRIDLRLALHYPRKLGLVIGGGESGPNARPMHPAWARGLRDQCQEAGVAFHFKQWGEWAPALGRRSGDRGKFVVGGYPDQPSRVWELAEWPRAPGLFEASVQMDRVGKKAAGRMLDGRTWDEMPGSASPKAAPIMRETIRREPRSWPGY